MGLEVKFDGVGWVERERLKAKIQTPQRAQPIMLHPGSFGLQPQHNVCLMGSAR